MYLNIRIHRQRIPLYIGLLFASLFASFMLGIGVKTFNAPSNISMTTTSSVHPQDKLMEKLEAIQELHTAVATIQTVVSAEEENEFWGLNLGSKKLLYVAVGNVRAGVDLRKVEPSAVKFVDGKLEINPMPPAEILDIKLDIKRSYVYDVQKRLWAPVATHLQSEAQKMAYEEIQKSAISCGVLELAQDQAKRSLELAQ